MNDHRAGPPATREVAAQRFAELRDLAAEGERRFLERMRAEVAPVERCAHGRPVGLCAYPECAPDDAQDADA